ncbi:MAG TPA: hypothetical protein VMW75_15120 [Thermoanaerobaculia bacterium]|nr:hypothetical protein [Thermoanaerobaculia bacterium]
MKLGWGAALVAATVAAAGPRAGPGTGAMGQIAPSAAQGPNAARQSNRPAAALETAPAPAAAEFPAPSAATTAAIAWAVDPAAPGPNLPPAGRSLFDQLTSDPAAPAGGGSGANVPFPFAALVRWIEERVGSDPAGQAPLRRVLIPFSRSLQRNAASPDFFTYPRAVLAVDGEPDPARGTVAGPLLKDRLFLGYQEKAGVLEVISYNDEAGRFEFQVVRDYRPGGEPSVAYAQRSLCASCHQNGAPIFSRQLWDETNANPRIAAELRRRGRELYGFPLEQGVDVPYAFQAAADRANLLAVYQRLWRDGCGAGDGKRQNDCRTALFVAVLQDALTAGRRFDAGADAFRRRFAEPFAANWRRLWPHGLAIPDADLPNRDPLAGSPSEPKQYSVSQQLASSEAALLAEVVRRSQIPARLEPLSPRPPLESWTPGDGTVERLVTGLADFLPLGDTLTLDRRLFDLGSAPGQPRRTHAAPCRFELRRPAPGAGTASGPAAVDRIKFACGAGDGAPAGLALAGRVFLDGERIAGGEVETVALDGREEMTDLAVTGGSLAHPRGDEPGHGSWQLRLSLGEKLSSLHARLARGDAVEDLVLTLPSPGPEPLPSARAPRSLGPETRSPVPQPLPSGPGPLPPGQGPLPSGPEPRQPPAAAAPLAGRAELRLLEDFARAESAVAALSAAAPEHGGGVFGDAPFRGAALIGALFARLGLDVPPNAAAPAAAERSPAATAAAAAAAAAAVAAAEAAGLTPQPASASPAVRTFLRYCASCHRTADPSPPNFLAGDAGRISANLAHCAERLFFRLSMWQLAAEGRAKTPMPPASALRGLEIDPESWPRHPDLALLTGYAENVLRRQTGEAPRLDALAARGYEGLRSCLPPAAAAP